MPVLLPVIELTLRVTPLPLGSTKIPDPTFADRLFPCTRASFEAVTVIPPMELAVTVLFMTRLLSEPHTAIPSPLRGTLFDSTRLEGEECRRIPSAAFPAKLCAQTRRD